MSEIYEALRDAERQKSAARRPAAIPAPIDAPVVADAPGAAAPEPSSEAKPSLIRGVRERLERLKVKSSGVDKAPAGKSALTVLTLTGGVKTEGAPAEDRVSEAASPQQLEDVAFELLRQLATLEGRFVALAEQLAGAVDELRAGRPAAGPLGAEVTACKADFDTLRERVVEVAPAAALAESATSPSATLNDLLTVLQAAMEMERQRQEFDETRRRAAAELERVLRLVHGEGGAFPPLDRCQNKARELSAQVTKAEWPELPSECTLLAERQHAFSRLLDLVERGGELSDEDWQAAEEAVASSFGKPLAIAVGRGRLRLEGGAGGAGGSP
jgi:hypothetical protein